MTEVRVRVWEPSRLLTAAYLYLSDRCADRQLCTGNNSIMCVSFGPTWSLSAPQRSAIYNRRFNHLFTSFEVKKNPGKHLKISILSKIKKVLNSQMGLFHNYVDKNASKRCLFPLRISISNYRAGLMPLQR